MSFVVVKSARFSGTRSLLGGETENVVSQRNSPSARTTIHLDYVSRHSSLENDL